jgi:alpha-1,6-mannosyltransferase
MMQGVSSIFQRRPLLILIGLGVANTAIWWFAFGGRYPLSEHGWKPLQSLASLNENSLMSAVLYIAANLLLFILWWEGVKWVERVKRWGWIVLIGGMIAFNAALLPMHPMDAADIYDYIIRGRMTAIYGLNPMKDVPSQVPIYDDVLRFAAWKDANSAYGPLWETIAAVTVRLSPTDRDGQVITFKLLACLGYALTAAGVAWTLRGSDRGRMGLYLFAWNPLMVYFAGGTAHNDLLMAAFMVWAVGCMVRRWYGVAILLAVLGALIKFIPLILIPIILIMMWRDESLRRQVQTWVIAGGLSLVLIGVCYAPYWAGIDSLALDRRSRMFTSSLGTLARQAAYPLLSDQAGGLVSAGLLGLLAIFATWTLWKLVIRQLDPIPATLHILLFYLLVSTIWFQHWYLVWVIPLAVLLPDTPARRLTFWFSYIVTWQPLIYNYVTLRYTGWIDEPWRDLIPISVFMGGTYLYAAWLWIRQRRTASYLDKSGDSDGRLGTPLRS